MASLIQYECVYVFKLRPGYSTPMSHTSAFTRYEWMSGSALTNRLLCIRIGNRRLDLTEQMERASATLGILVKGKRLDVSMNMRRGLHR
jgi:hypothetical protein